MVRQAIYTDADFENLLAAGADWEFSGSKSDQLLHGIHPYPAKFIAEIPRKAIELWSPVGGTVLDPFAGVGTTLLEAQMAGRSAIGIDSNPVGVLVTKAKTQRYTKADFKRLSAFYETLEAEYLAPRPDIELDDERFRSWFNPVDLEALYAIKGAIMGQAKAIQPLLLCTLSAIVVRVSKQDSDTRYARLHKDEIGFQEVVSIYKGKLKKTLASLQSFVDLETIPAKIFSADSREQVNIEPKSVDLVVTSPPYLNAYDYHKYHRQRIHMIDGDAAFTRRAEIGGHDQFTRPKATPEAFFMDLGKCLDTWSVYLKNGGRAFVLIGDAIVHGQPVKVGDRFISLAEERGFSLEWRAIRPIKRSTKSFGVGARMDLEHMILLRKH